MPLCSADDGCRIYFARQGEGLPCLMIPGLGGEGAFWNAAALHMPEGLELILMDHRGTGGSDRPDGEYSIPRIAQDARNLLDALDIASAVLIGHSTGGMVAQTLATSVPDRVRALVLSGTWAHVDTRFRRMFEAREALLRDGGAISHQKLTQALGYPASWIEANRTALDAELLAAEERLQPRAVHLARLQMLCRHDVHEALPGISKPTLVIGAPDDGLIPFSASRDLASSIPGARLEALEGGHFFPRTRAGDYARLVVDFLQDLPL